MPSDDDLKSSDDDLKPSDDELKPGNDDLKSSDDPKASNELKPGNDDIKAKMLAALKNKQGNDTGVDQSARGKGKAPGTHGPLGGVQMHRRKAGGGGS
jgi:hypothetical protein